MKNQEEELKNMMKRPIPKKKIGIVKLQMVKESSLLYGTKRMSNPQEAAEVVRPIFAYADREMVVVMSVDAKMTPLALEIVAVGGTAHCSVDMKDLYKHAIINNAVGIICFHNHPSGVAEFSQEDIHLSRRMVEAGQWLGIKIYDHIVIGEGESYQSMRESKLLDFPCQEVA